MLPLIAIIGKPNTGKSTLFNRLVGRRKAIESHISGTTRDRIFEKIKIDESELILIDTGGIEKGDKENIEASVQEQAKMAIADASLIIFLVDGSQELTTDDFFVSSLLRKAGKKVMLVINKCDTPKIQESARLKFFELGFGSPIIISGLTGGGITDLQNEILKLLKKLKLDKRSIPMYEGNAIKISLIGRPNTGKSTLINAFLNEKKMITSEIPGTTRDSVSHSLKYHEKDFVLIDTAGIRKRGKIEKGIEKFSIMRVLQSIEESDVIFWLIDCKDGVTSQDKHVCQYALERFKGIVLAVNKSDLFEFKEETMGEFLGYLRRQLPFVPFAPVVFISALNKKNINELLDLSINILANRTKTIEEKDFNLFLKKITGKYLPETKSKFKLKIYEGGQIDVSPPTFLIYINSRKLMHFSYKRYLENQIREEYDFGGTAIKILFKEKRV